LSGSQGWYQADSVLQIFPVTYVEALAEPTTRELQEEAQMEAKVFASLGELD
jgi:signal transducing adaptor molecule